MIRLLRRSRLLAVVLLLATPALGGAWLQALHPCPVDSPWLADAGAHGGGHHDAGEQAPKTCHCVGSCAAVGIAVLPRLAESLTTPVSVPRANPEFPPHTDPATYRPAHLLPPSTAPPLG